MHYCVANLIIVFHLFSIKVIPLISNDIYEFGWRLLYDISFFIIVTTIGLNIVFGIIVDTFSELRDERVGTKSTCSKTTTLTELLSGMHKLPNVVHIYTVKPTVHLQ